MAHRILTTSVVLILSLAGLEIADAFPLYPLDNHGCQQFTSSTYVDNSNAAAGFGGGTMSNTTWNVGNSRMELTGGQSSGTFTSRVFDSQGCTHFAPWWTFSWTTSLPYLKEIPGTSEAAAAYSAIVGNMLTSVYGVWHFDEGLYTGAASQVTDSSGAGHHMTASGAVTNSTSGLFSDAFSNGASTQTLSTASFAMNATNNTVAFWIKTSNGTASAPLFSQGTTATGWVATLDATVGHVPTVTVGGTACAATTNVANNAWHHIAVVTDAAKSLKVYIDGTVEGNCTYAGNITASAVFNFNPPDLTDELGYWQRSLTATEIQQLWRRGANRTTFQVRTCTASDCSDNPAWLGLATQQTTISELHNSAATAPSMTLNSVQFAPRQRYFQYKFSFATDNTAFTPDVKSVTIGRSKMVAPTPVRIYLTAGTTSWTVPADFNQANNTIEALGGGGGGAANTSVTSAGAGGGGAYGQITNQTLTPGAGVQVNAGTAGTAGPGPNGAGGGGGDTWFNTSSCAAPLCSKGGAGGSGTSGGSGGLAASGFGNGKTNGGFGNNGSGGNKGGGGGGAGGATAAGNPTSSGSTQSGGQGDPTAGGAGGGAGAAGSPGQEWDATHGSGGGGGGGNNGAVGGAAGAYGAGGGGSGKSGANGGAGGAGLIVITYTP